MKELVDTCTNNTLFVHKNLVLNVDVLEGGCVLDASAYLRTLNQSHMNKRLPRKRRWPIARIGQPRQPAPYATLRQSRPPPLIGKF